MKKKMDSEPLKQHPAGTIIPPPTPEEQENLEKNIQANGLLVAIVLFANQILDGWSRYQACLKVDVKPHFVRIEEMKFDQPFDPFSYVVTMNLHRRMLSTSQRALIAAQCIERQKEQKPTRVSGAGKASVTAGKLWGVSPRAVEQGLKVVQEGTPEVVDAVRKGDIPVSTAEKIVMRPGKEQLSALKDAEKCARTTRKENGVAKSPPKINWIQRSGPEISSSSAYRLLIAFSTEPSSEILTKIEHAAGHAAVFVSSDLAEKLNCSSKLNETGSSSNNGDGKKVLVSTEEMGL